jgi:WD40 repeat protein
MSRESSCPLQTEAGMDQTSGSTEPSLSFGGLSEFLGDPDALVNDACQLGTRLGDVTLLKLIGEGGMGRVFQGRQDRPDRIVAVKVIRPGLLSRAAAKRFELEAQILGRLSHPAIAQIYSAGIEQVGGQLVPYFVMEYVEEGIAITRFAQRQELSTKDRVELIQKAVAAVAHGHQRGVVHRDLKPGNILVAADGQPKIIDFGVARGTDGDVALTTFHTDAGQLVGTLQYMSPEQLAGNADDLDIRADVYSLGVVLYELLAGRPPYDVRNRPIHEAARIVTEAEPAQLSSVSPRFRGDLTTIVTKCLDKDRNCRYSSAAEVEADLGRYLRGEPILASPPSLADSLRRIFRRHRTVAIATLGIVGALILGTVGTTIYAVRAERQRQAAVASQSRADTAAALATRRLYIANLRALQAAITTKNLRQARRVFQENAELAGSPLPLELGCLLPALDEALVVLTPGSGPVTALDWNDTGTQLAVRTIDPVTSQTTSQPLLTRRLLELPPTINNSIRGNFHLYDVTPKPRRSDASMTADWLRSWRAEQGDFTALAALTSAGLPVASCQDGQRMAVQAADGRIQILSQPSGELLTSLSKPPGRIRGIRFVDGQRRLLIESANRLMLWDAATGVKLFETDMDDTVRRYTISQTGSHLAIALYQHVSTGRADRVEVIATKNGNRLMVASLRASGTNSETVLALDPSGEQLYACSDERTIHAWETSSGRLIGDLSGHQANVSALAATATGQLASGATNGHLRLWDVPQQHCLRDWIGHPDAILTLAFDPADNTIASGGYDGTVRLWKPDLPAKLAFIPTALPPTATSLSPSGNLLAIGTTDRIELWDSRAAILIKSLPTAFGSLTMLAFSPTGDQLAASFRTPAKTGQTAIWSLNAQSAPLLLSDNAVTTGEHWTVCFSPDGKTVLTSTGKSLTAWDVADGKENFQVREHSVSRMAQVSPVFGLAGKRLAYQRAALFDGSTGQPMAELAPHGLVTANAVSPNGRMLARGLAVGKILICNFETGATITATTAHAGSVLTLAISPDNRLVASGGTDGTAQIWDIEANREVRRFHGHEGQVEKVLFSPDGRRLITASHDGTVRIWDTSDGQELLTLPGSAANPATVLLTPNGERLVTVIGTETDRPGLQIWGLSNAEAFKARQARPKLAGESDDKAPPVSSETPPDRPIPAG